jgi:hypothetical protein
MLASRSGSASSSWPLRQSSRDCRGRSLQRSGRRSISVQALLGLHEQAQKELVAVAEAARAYIG